jgi:hypothetical protein
MRMGVGFTVVTSLILIAAGVGAWRMNEATTVERRIETLERLGDRVDTLRWYLSSLTGWQGLVVADAAISGYEVAADPESYNRSGLLREKAGVYQYMQDTPTDAMTPASGPPGTVCTTSGTPSSPRTTSSWRTWRSARPPATPPP